MPKNFFKKNAGYFLIDVLVTFSVIAFLSTISIPYFRKYQPNLKLNATSRDLTSDLRYAQQLTVTEQVPHSVNFYLDTDRYQILKLGEDTTVVKTVDLDPDVSFYQIDALSGDQVVFNFYGGVSESGQITLININSKTAVINIKPSGYVQLVQ